MPPSRRGTLSVLAGIGVWLCSAPGETSADMHQYLFQIAQPIVSRGGQAVELQYVTYALNVSGLTPGLALRYTCHPGPGVVHQDASRDTVDFSEITNLNIANLMGISLQVENRPRGSWNVEVDSSRNEEGSAGGRFYVDRLRVVLNLKAMSEREPGSSDPEYRTTIARHDAVVAATVDCILDNASRSDPPIRKIDLSVIGPQRYRRFARVYAINEVVKRKQYKF